MPIGLLNAASQWYGGPSAQYYPGSTVANLNQNQYGGYQSMLGAANQVGGYAPGMLDAAQNSMRGYQDYLQRGGAGINPQLTRAFSPEDINAIQGNFEVSPYVEGVGDAFTQAAQRAFERNVLPTLTSNAIQAGQMGSSRHGIAQGIATSDYNQQLQENLAGVQSQAWQQAMQNQLANREQTLSALGQDRGRATQAALGDAQNQISAYGLQPSMFNAYGNLLQTAQGAMAAPGQLQSQFGGMQQQTAQQQLNDAVNRWGFYQNQPLSRLQQYQGLLAQAPVAGVGQTYTPVNPIASGLQGFGAGYNMFSNMGGIGGWGGGSTSGGTGGGTWV